jgi:hypothetical protein
MTDDLAKCLKSPVAKKGGATVPADDFKKELLDVLEYYADAAHYKEFVTPGGRRQPGVLTEGGAKARAAIAKFWPDT